MRSYSEPQSTGNLLRIPVSGGIASVLRSIWPVRLGGQCKWEISSRIQDGKVLVSAGLKDRNGCTLRVVRRASKTVSPTLTLIQDGKVKTEQKMEFG